MRLIRTLGDLKEVLSVYDDDLPVRFVSAEAGGFWPRGKGEMEIGVDEAVARVERVGGQVPPFVQVMLMRVDEVPLPRDTKDMMSTPDGRRRLFNVLSAMERWAQSSSDEDKGMPTAKLGTPLPGEREWLLGGKYVRFTPRHEASVYRKGSTQEWSGFWSLTIKGVILLQELEKKAVRRPDGRMAYPQGGDA